MAQERRHAASRVGCPLSRRRFLQAIPAAAGAAGLLGATRAHAAGGLGESADGRCLRPKPQVNIAAVVLRHEPPYWLGWPGEAHGGEDKHDETVRLVRESCARLGLRLDLAKGPLENNGAVTAFADKIGAERPHAVVVVLQHMGAWGWADRLSRVGVPTIIFAPVGAAFTGHVLNVSRRPGVHVVSSPEYSAVQQALRQAVALRRE